MKNALCLLLALFTSVTAQANFTGRWAGEGIMTGKEGKKYVCEDLQINVFHKPEMIEFGDFYYGCGGFAFRFHPPVLKYVTPTEVLWKDMPVGTVTRTEANLLFVINDKNGRARYTVKKLSNTKLSYKDEQFDLDPQTGKEIPVITMEGTLNFSP